MTSNLFPTSDLNISHHIKQQALEHVSTCGYLRGSDKLEVERKQENKGGKEREMMSGRAKETASSLNYSHAHTK